MGVLDLSIRKFIVSYSYVIPDQGCLFVAGTDCAGILSHAADSTHKLEMQKNK